MTKTSMIITTIDEKKNTNQNDQPHQEMNTTNQEMKKYDESKLCSQHENTICQLIRTSRASGNTRWFRHNELPSYRFQEGVNSRIVKFYTTHTDQPHQEMNTTHTDQPHQEMNTTQPGDEEI